MIFWIASYPKSGNTWVRALLSSYYYSDDGFFNQRLLENIGQFPEKNYFNDFDYDPKNIIDTSKFWIKAQEKINNDNKLRFLKTHNILGKINKFSFTDKKNSIGGLYIVRDPRNVITSLQNHFELNMDDALNFMLDDKKFIYDYRKKNDFGDFQFISSWEKNYQSWIKQINFPIKVIKYEDLNNKTYETFKEIIQFVDDVINNKKNFNDLKAKNTIQSTTFAKMKQIEKTDGFFESVLSKKKSNKIPFFHLGPKNDWKKLISKDYQKKLNLIFKKNLVELNYI